MVLHLHSRYAAPVPEPISVGDMAYLRRGSTTLPTFQSPLSRAATSRFCFSKIASAKSLPDTSVHPHPRSDWLSTGWDPPEHGCCKDKRTAVILCSAMATTQGEEHVSLPDCRIELLAFPPRGLLALLLSIFLFCFSLLLLSPLHSSPISWHHNISGFGTLCSTTMESMVST